MVSVETTLNIIKEKQWLNRKINNLLELFTKVTVYTYKDTIIANWWNENRIKISIGFSQIYGMV